MIDSAEAITAVAEVLKDKLHTTADEDLQAGLYQLLEYAGQLERQREAAVWVLNQ